MSIIWENALYKNKSRIKPQATLIGHLLRIEMLSDIKEAWNMVSEMLLGMTLTSLLRTSTFYLFCFSPPSLREVLVVKWRVPFISLCFVFPQEMEQSMNMLNSNHELPDVSEFMTRLFSSKSSGKSSSGSSKTGKSGTGKRR